MYEDDKGRGSYKCGRCGVPKKGHVCPYQPKVKRRPEEPIPEMKCVSTQVEMDEFMTLRRLNIEIQGFPESYAAEPMDMVGAEVHSHPPQVLVSGIGNGVPSYAAASASHPVAPAPLVEQNHPAGVPSLASMNSHSHPSSYPPSQAAPYSHQPTIPPPNPMPEPEPLKPAHLEPAPLKTEYTEPTAELVVLKSEQSTDPETASLPIDSVEEPKSTKQSDISVSAPLKTETSEVDQPVAESTATDASSNPTKTEEVKTEPEVEPKSEVEPKAEVNVESTDTQEAEADNKRQRVE
jgi:hypothetical protein